jgi:hypothetical protein
VLRPGSSVAAGAHVKQAVVLPGAEVPEGAVVAGGVHGHRGALS